MGLKQHAPPSEQPKSARCSIPDGCLVLIVAGLLGLAGATLLLVGAGAIEQQSYDLNWEGTSSVGLGPIDIGAAQTHGRVEYRGADGIRVGVGLVAVGSMLVDWSGLLLWVYARRRVGGRLRVLRLLLGWLSFACLIISVVSFFPPWRLEAASFWAVLFLGSVAPLWLVRKRASWSAGLFVIFVALTVAAGYLSIEVSVGMFLGFWATLIGYIHLLVLGPALGKWILAKTALPAGASGSGVELRPSRAEPGTAPDRGGV